MRAERCSGVGSGSFRRWRSFSPGLRLEIFLSEFLVVFAEGFPDLVPQLVELQPEPTAEFGGGGVLKEGEGLVGQGFEGGPVLALLLELLLALAVGVADEVVEQGRLS